MDSNELGGIDVKQKRVRVTQRSTPLSHDLPCVHRGHEVKVLLRAEACLFVTPFGPQMLRLEPIVPTAALTTRILLPSLYKYNYFAPPERCLVERG